MSDVRRVLGDPPVVVAREVTKLYEEFLRGSASEVLERLKKKPVKGEITILVGLHALAEDGPQGGTIREDLERLMKEQGIDERAALKLVARARRIPKSEAYRQWQSEKSPGR